MKLLCGEEAKSFVDLFDLVKVCSDQWRKIENRNSRILDWRLEIYGKIEQIEQLNGQTEGASKRNALPTIPGSDQVWTVQVKHGSFDRVHLQNKQAELKSC